MKIKRFFESNSSINNICRDCGISYYSINEDGTIDVDGEVYLFNKKLKKLPLKFRNINGNFNCHYNLLSSLEGAPISIQGNFDCEMNQLTSFKGFPEYIKGYILLAGNPINEIYRLNPCRDFIEMLNEYDVIRDGNKIIEMRLRQALEDSECEDNFLDDFKFENYDLI